MPRIGPGRRSAAIASLGATLLLTAACTSGGSGGNGPSTTPSSSPVNLSILGKADKATGTPIKFGYVNDGAGGGIDNSPLWPAAQAAASYANDYLGGFNGHVIQLDHCETQNTPTGAVDCGVQMLKDKVAAVLVGFSAQDGKVFSTLDGKIPYVADQAADIGILTSPTAFVLTSPLAGLAAGIKAAHDAGVKKDALVLIDVPAASFVEALEAPYFQKLGISVDLVKISASVADPTPQIQQAISRGDGAFGVVGTPDFDTAALTSLKQLGFHGPILVSEDPFPAALGGQSNILNSAILTTEPSDHDVQVLHAVEQKYGSFPTTGNVGYQTVLSFVRALSGVKNATTPATITKALATMPKPVKTALGGGVTFQCGQKPFQFIPSACGISGLVGSPSTDGTIKKYTIVNPKKILG